MMNETDVAAIAHLDFELKEDKAIPCKGWSYRHDDTGEIGKVFNCASKAEAVLKATRVCCGYTAYFCLNCYNEICQLHASHPAGITHTRCGTVVKGKAYLDDVEWL